MSWSRRKLIVAGVVGGGVALLAAAALFSGGAIRACSTVGYANVSPIELEFDSGLEVDAAAACFGTDCLPVPISPGGSGVWSVPQSEQYLQLAAPGNVTHVAVRAESDGEVVVDQVLEVRRERVGGFEWPECPGPFRYLPVTIGA